ncbi:MAG TPA: VWA domain-containing protein [Pyrinomonadaceae bacterium]|jgi:Ca-activated chloride channel family protein|nr:VWA domain-containing protein [Pyrinomonadaceae bacterium]
MKLYVQTFLLLFSLCALVQAQQSPTPSPSPAGASARPSPVATPSVEEVGEGEVLHISSNLVSVPVSVMNRQGQYVVDLHRQDFRVYEDGKEQTIVHFSNVDQPFSVVLLIDTSGSTAPFIDQIKGAAKAFLEQLRPSDTIRPVYFHGEIKPLTAAGVNDPKLFSAAIDQIEPGPVNMGTRLYDAVAFGLGALKPVAARKAIVLITDGENTWGKATMKGTLREAEESDIIVYTLQYGDLLPQKYLQQLADKTGGRYFKGGDTNSIRQSFVAVAEELRRQYVLGYHPSEPARGGVRKIRVKVNRAHVAVRARGSYTYGQDASRND